MDALFISDLHLDDSRPDLLEGFSRFLDVWGIQARRLFILGDLFELWIGDDQPGETARTVMRQLASVSARGVDVAFIAGNRDFLLGDGWAKPARTRLLAGPTVDTLGSLKTVLSHGDEFCTDDRDYQDFKRMVRDPRWISAFLQRPLDTRLQMAKGMRKESESRGKAKPEAIVDVSPKAIEDSFRTTGARLMVHGHVHRPAVHSHQIDGREAKRIVLGDWSDTGWMATIEGASSHLLSFPLRQPGQVRRCGT